MYLTKEELKTVATKEVIDLITQGDEQIVTQIIAESIDLMASYLYKYYDTEAIFAKEGDERSKILLKYLKDILKTRNGCSLFECKGISVFLTLLARSSPMGFQKNLQSLSVVLRVVFF